jgi:hypothetical protein
MPPSWADPQNLATFSPEKKRAFLTNPFSTSPDDPVQLVAVKDGQVIGKMDLIAGEATLDATPIPVLWASSLYVPPEHRKSMAGALLVMKMHSVHPTCAVCGVSAAALPIYEKLKWIDMPMSRYIWLRKSRTVVERYVGNTLVRPIARVAADAGLLVQRAGLRILAAVRGRGVVVERVGQLPSDLDGLISERLKSGLAFRRSKAWIDWAASNVLEVTSGGAVRDLAVVRDRRGTPLGYFLTKCRHYDVATQRQLRDLTLASVQDWMTFDERRLPERTLVLLAALHAASLRLPGSGRSPDAVEVCTREVGLQSALRRLGLAPAGQLHLLYRAGPVSPLAKLTDADRASWRLRPAEGDNFFA